MRPDARRRQVIATGMALGAVLATWQAQAAPGDSEAVPEFITAVIPHAKLSGAGRFRKYMFHIYDARLYLGPEGFHSDEPKALPFALDLEYARHFTGRDIARITTEEFERLDAGTPAQRAQWNDVLIKLLPDVDEGQHLTGMFLPASGLRLYSNGTLVGSVDDIDFARWFFAIWLDPRTQSPPLRAALLGGGALP